ncbi:MAG: endonuclease/exonuclease/phosphatase family protein [Devosia sp.]
MTALLGFLRLVAIVLVLATALPAMLALFGFAVPLLDLFNHLQLIWLAGTLVGLIALLMLRASLPWTVLALLGLAASAFAVVPEWTSSLAARPAPPAGVRTVTVMTHNVFGLNYDMARLAQVIADENPDIVALQEYFPEQVRRLDPLLKASYPYSVRCEGGKRANLGLYSKLPFDKEMGKADCPDDPSRQRTAHILARFVLADGTAFSLLTTHMDWPFPLDRQRSEFEAIEDVVGTVQGPLAVVGDFNSTAWSYALRGFGSAAGLTRETRSVLTYPERFTTPGGLAQTIPILPLDQVFERGLTVSELHRGPATGSDHRPVIFSFSVAR